MNLSPERLSGLAADTGFRSESLEKVIRLGELLADIGRHPLLSRVLALKGGTALNLSFGPPPRLSVDLDFNYVGHLERTKMLEERPDVERAIETIGRGQGYQVQLSAEEHAGRKYYLSYRGANGMVDRIEVDLNFMFRIPLGEMRELSLWQPAGIEQPKTRIVPLEELFAGKVRALLDRMLPRDLFDATRLPQHDAKIWGTPRFHKIFVALAGTLPRPLGTYDRQRLDRVTQRIVREQLAPMVHASIRLSSDKLKTDAWNVIEPLLRLDSAERDYIDWIHRGELRPELLFPEDRDLSERIGKHPALNWKVANVRKALARKP